MKVNMRELKKALNQATGALWTLGEGSIAQSLSDWEDEYNETLNELFSDSDYYRVWYKSVANLLERSISCLQKSHAALQESLETNNSAKTHEALLTLNTALYNTTKDIRNTLPKIKAELAVGKYGFDEIHKDSLEELFTDIQRSNECRPLIDKRFIM